MHDLSRREFLAAAGAAGGAALLAGCGSSSSSGPSTPKSRPPISKESGKLSILEWGGYEAGGTKAQKSGMWAGTPYTEKFGPNGISYTYIISDDQAVQKAATSGPFDIMHPCAYMLEPYVQQNLVQPWDTSLMPSFKEIDPVMLKYGQVNGKQYLIPWDWGYSSLMYRTDKVDPADATGWELAWNPKYKGRVSLQDTASNSMELTALKLGFPKMDDMTPGQIQQAKQALIQQKPLNKFYWDSEFGQMRPAFKSGDIWIAYAWQAAYATFKQAGMKVAYMQPSQGRLEWVCGFTLGAQTQNYYHAHDYVESFINQRACAQMMNLYYYGTSNMAVKPSEIKNKELVNELKMTGSQARRAADLHIQSYEPNRTAYEQAWQEVKA